MRYMRILLVTLFLLSSGCKNTPESDHDVYQPGFKILTFVSTRQRLHAIVEITSHERATLHAGWSGDLELGKDKWLLPAGKHYLSLIMTKNDDAYFHSRTLSSNAAEMVDRFALPTLPSSLKGTWDFMLLSDREAALEQGEKVDLVKFAKDDLTCVYQIAILESE
jgi:hypothetical protein